LIGAVPWRLIALPFGSVPFVKIGTILS